MFPFGPRVPVYYLNIISCNILIEGLYVIGFELVPVGCYSSLRMSDGCPLSPIIDKRRYKDGH